MKLVVSFNNKKKYENAVTMSDEDTEVVRTIVKNIASKKGDWDQADVLHFAAIVTKCVDDNEKEENYIDEVEVHVFDDTDFIDNVQKHLYSMGLHVQVDVR